MYVINTILEVEKMTLQRILSFLLALLLLGCLLPVQVLADSTAAPSESTEQTKELPRVLDPADVSARLDVLETTTLPEGTPDPYSSKGIAYQWIFHYNGKSKIMALSDCTGTAASIQDSATASVREYALSYQAVNAIPATFPISANDTPYRFDNLLPSDIICFKSHWVLVVSREGDVIRVVEFISGKVSWSRRLRKADVNSSALYVLTRYDKADGKIYPINTHKGCPCAQFKDLPAYGSPEHEAIDWAFTHNVTAGVDERHFGIDEPVTRAQFVTFLWAGLTGRTEVSDLTACAFRDVPAGKYFAKPIRWAVSRSITAGIDENHFGPTQTCTRGEVLTFLRAAAGFPEPRIASPYSDIQGRFYAKAACWANEMDMEHGKGGLFAANTPCTRCSTVTYLYLYLRNSGTLN